MTGIAVPLVIGAVWLGLRRCTTSSLLSIEAACQELAIRVWVASR
jgi:hypothetical protein